jgi:hypothetical protein
MDAMPAVFVSLVALYVLVGMACAALALARAWSMPGAISDAALLLGFWPLYGPFLLVRAQQAGELPSDKEAAFLAAVRRASGTPLGRLLPDGATAQALARGLRAAARRVHELESLLARPDFQEEAAVARLAQLERAGASPAALSSAGMRLQNVRRLRALRDRFAGELDEVGELLAQLTAQAEVLRLSRAADAAAGELVGELLARVEGLDGILGDEGNRNASA